MIEKKDQGTPPIINSFDEFIKEDKKDIFVEEWEKAQEEKQKTIEQRFDAERLEWTKKINDMSNQLRKVMEIQDLLTNVYTERQRGLEYYHYLITLLTKINASYRKQYAQKYEHYSFSSQKRFPNEATKNNQILSEMEEVLSKKEALANHSEFMKDTVKTIDSLIFGVKYRIEIEQISRGR
jgi:hypothetical protein